MEPLLPRAANIQVKPKATKAVGKPTVKPVEAKKTANQKEHAPEPPAVVVQPPVDESSLSESYKTGNHLGKGGFAVCYEGELQCHRPSIKEHIYALKIVPANMKSKRMEDKFRTELQIHAKLHHPNIVEFHRAFTFKDSTYVVLELCRSGSVMDLVKKRGSLSLPEVRRFTVQLCGAVKYMHARNVIHRDLKMGNLFLDHDMNLKIGDFGLAAVLVSKSEYEGVYNKNFSRRTTLCGTPNYIAPEILEKAKGGHDHKVDIWAIGVILFAMITGFPPFQSTSQEEIYRKAKNIEYDWPENNTNSRRCHNDIPPEAKNLVACLLKVDAEARPTPDGIVGHKFFSMHGGNAIPLALDPSCRRQKPSWLLEQTPRGDVMDNITPRLELRTLAQQCGVGHPKGRMWPNEVVGDNVEISLYKECVAEEHVDKSPLVPLPDDMVYCSTTSLQTWPNRQSPVADSSTSTRPVGYGETQRPKSETARIEVQPPKAVMPFQVVQPPPPRRGPVQSHAATLRAAHAGIKQNQMVSNSRQECHNPSAGTQRGASTRRLLKELPARQNLTSAGSTGTRSELPQRQSSRLTRSAKANSDASQPSAVERATESDAPEADQERRENSAKTEARIAANVQGEIEEAKLGKRGPRRLKGSIPKVSVREASRESSLIGPDEIAESMVGTTPKAVRASLRRLHDELISCLNSTSRYNGDHRSMVAQSTKSLEDRPLVTQWVDYAQRFGVGYILENGTVGGIFRTEDGKPPSHIVVARSESHIRNRLLNDYADKHQVVRADGAPVAFYEDCGEEGLQRVLVSPKNFQILEHQALTDFFQHGSDDYDTKKRGQLALFDKFAKYMTQNLGGVDVGDSTPNPSEPVGPFIRFYQRMGNVGIWGYGDGSFQFNFPDHTKLVVSPDAAWLDVCFLSIQSAQALKRGELLGSGTLSDRSRLRYPTSVMLKGSYGEHDFKLLSLENELRAKVIFVKNTVATWLKAGGLGRTVGDQRMKWEGMGENVNGGRLIWVTVGAYGEDQKRVEQRPS